MRRKHTPEDVDILFKEKGFECLNSDEYISVKKPNLTAKCKNNHTWKVSYSNIQQGSTCPHCSGNFKKTPKDVDILFKEKGFKCLNSDEYVNNTTPNLIAECKNNHTWKVRYNDIKQGSSCPKCYGNFKKTPEDVDRLFKEKGFKCLNSDEYKSALKPNLIAECKNNHTWKVSYNSIHQGRSCPHCSGNFKHTPEDVDRLFKEKGFKCLNSYEYINNNKPNLIAECKNNHTWKVCYNNIEKGSGCPHCSNKTEQECREIFEEMFKPYKFPSSHPKFLKIKKRKKGLELDGYCKELNLAFEYDGEQHFDKNHMWYSEEGVLRDRLKDELCNKKGVTLIRIPYTEKENLNEYIKLKTVELLTRRGMYQ